MMYANYCKIRKHRKLKIEKFITVHWQNQSPPHPMDVLLLIHYCQNKTRNHWSQDHNHLSYLYHASFTRRYWSHWFLHFLSYFPLLLPPPLSCSLIHCFYFYLISIPHSCFLYCLFLSSIYLFLYTFVSFYFIIYFSLPSLSHLLTLSFPSSLIFPLLSPIFPLYFLFFLPFVCFPMHSVSSFRVHSLPLVLSPLLSLILTYKYSSSIFFLNFSPVLSTWILLFFCKVFSSWIFLLYISVFSSYNY